VVHQVSNALKYIHDFDIIHRDIKCENILISSDDRFMIGDFGLSKQMIAFSKRTMAQVGTYNYMSPQQIAKQKYSVKTDIWSLGVVLYRMCTFRFPFDSEDLLEMSKLIEKGDFEPIPEGSYSKGLIKLQAQMLQIEEAARPDIEIIISTIKALKNDVAQVVLPVPEPIPEAKAEPEEEKKEAPVKDEEKLVKDLDNLKIQGDIQQPSPAAFSFASLVSNTNDKDYFAVKYVNKYRVVSRLGCLLQVFEGGNFIKDIRLK
jgi:NIMA (never in mitosis gene a)-related kinase